MILTLVTESTSEPITVDEAKTYLRMESTDSTAEDGLIGSFITVARKYAENYTKTAFVTQTRKLIFDDFSGSTSTIELPRPPVSTVSSNVSITYVEDTTAGNTTTIASTVYTVDADSRPARVFPSYGNEWPSSVRDQRNAVTIQFVSGYTTANVPEDVKTWIKMRVADMYENRQGLTEAQMMRLPRSHLDALLDPYVIPNVP